jgi:hypothetical protein
MKCHILPEYIEEMNKTKLATYKDITFGTRKSYEVLLVQIPFLQTIA